MLIIGRDYLLKKPAGPSLPKLFLDTRVVPLAVNAVGELEVVLDRASARTGIRPSVLLISFSALLSFVLYRTFRRLPE